ncbi:MAG: type IV pilus biogenesis protein PilP [Thermodesulfobacteriota bacterium]
MLFRGNRKRIVWIVGGGLAVLSLLFMGHLALSTWLAPPPPPVPVASKAPKASRPPAAQATQAKGAADTRESGAKSEGQPSAPPATGAAVPGVPVAGNLAVITTLRAQLEELRIQAAIAQEREKMLPKPVVVSAAQPKTLDLPEIPTPQLEQKPRRTSPMVVSVQGVDGQSTATVRLQSGELVSVRPGDRFNGGVVGSVSRSGVTIRRGGASTTLAFE